MGQPRPRCHLFSSFHTNLVASRIRTRINGVEGEDADHQTTTPAPTLARVILLFRLIFEAFQGCFFQSFPTKCVVCNSDSSVRLVCGAAVCLGCRKFFDETCDLVKSLFIFDQCSFFVNKKVFPWIWARLHTRQFIRCSTLANVMYKFHYEMIVQVHLNG